jgi:hypothetical protein
MGEADCKALRYAKVYDDGGKSFDQYTVFLYGNVYGMSHNPLSPQGFNQFVGETRDIPRPWSRLGKKVDAKDLPEDVKIAICRRVKRE